MTLTNFRKQTERRGPLRTEHSYRFTCHACSTAWSTPPRVYKFGFITDAVVGVTHGVHFSVPGIGWLQKATEAGRERFSKSVEREAMQLAAARYRVCPSCQRTVCPSCQDDQSESCADCRSQAQTGAASASAGAARTGPRCPACNASSDGGRFCPECGFDLAAAYKSCPACASQLPRQANYCPDCGHSF